MRKRQENHLPKVIAVGVAGLILVVAFVYLPDLRSAYQESKKQAESEETGDNTGSENTSYALTDGQTDETFDKAKLLAEWRNDTNLVDTDRGEEAADDPNAEKFQNIKIIREIPQSENEIRLAHESSRGYSCEIIPAGEPIELNDYKRYLTTGDIKGLNKNLDSIFMRNHLVSIGFGIRDEDQRQLPLLSANEILKYLEGNYLSLQVRIEKDSLDGTLFLHPRPLATLAKYRESRLTQPPQKAMSDSLKNYRGLGMYLDPGEEASLDALRTLVMVHRSERRVSIGTSASQIEPHYELMFVRATLEEGKRLKLHAFVTSENRKYLHYLRDRGIPSIPRFCTIQTMLAFTKFSGLRPVESVTTGSVVDDRMKIPMQQLDEYVSNQNLEGNALKHPNLILDAIIEGKIEAPAPLSNEDL